MGPVASFKWPSSELIRTRSNGQNNIRGFISGGRGAAGDGRDTEEVINRRTPPPRAKVGRRSERKSVAGVISSKWKSDTVMRGKSGTHEGSNDLPT